jgi:hypothetical protein
MYFGGCLSNHDLVSFDFLTQPCSEANVSVLFCLVEHKCLEYTLEAFVFSLQLPRLVSALPAEFKARKVPRVMKSKERSRRQGMLD